MGRNTLKDIANDKRKSLIEKIKQNKKLKKIQKYKNKVLFGLGVFGATALISPESSQNKREYNLSDIKIETTVNHISIDKEIVSAENFYKNVKYNHLSNKWVYKKGNGEKVNISDMIDNDYLNELNKKRLKDKGISFRFNDVPVSFKSDTIIKFDTLMYIPKGSLIYEVKTDSIDDPLFSYLGMGKMIKKDTIRMSPEKDILNVRADTIISERIFGKNKGSALTDSTITKGFYYSTKYGGNVVINRFVSDTTLTKEEQDKARKRFERKFRIKVDSLEQYDPKIESGDANKTSFHEYGHGSNEEDGIKSYGLSAEHTYLLTIHDEILANIKQLLAQREEYLKTGNIKTIKKSYYRDAVEKGKITPAETGISDEEKKFIAQETTKNWLKGSKEIYREQLKSISKEILGSSLMPDTENSDILYQNVLKSTYNNIKTPDGQTFEFFDFIEDIILDDKDKKTIEDLKKERGTNLGDELARIKNQYGENALIDFIWQEKVKLMEKNKKEREKHQKPLKPNSEAYIRRQREIEKEIIISKKKRLTY